MGTKTLCLHGYQSRACILHNYSCVSVRIVPGEGRQCILSIESYTVIVAMGSVDSEESTRCLFCCSWHG